MDPSNVQQYVSAVGQALEPLATKIGQGGTWMFTQAMKNNYAEAWMDVASLAACALAWIPNGLFLRWGSRPPNSDCSLSRFHYSEGLMVGAYFSTTALTILTIVAIVSVVFDAIPRFIAPEWHTIRDIAGMFHK